MPGLDALLREFGLGAVLALSVFGVMFWLVKNIIKDHREERKNFFGVISNHINSNSAAMNKVADKLSDHDRAQQEVNRYVRDEHREILKALMKLNGK